MAYGIYWIVQDCPIIIWSNQVYSIESFKRIVRQRLRDQFIQEWQSRVAENNVSRNYCLFLKRNFALKSI